MSLDECAVGVCTGGEWKYCHCAWCGSDGSHRQRNRARRDRRRGFKFEGNSLCCSARRRQSLATAATFATMARRARREQIRRGLRTDGIHARHKDDVNVAGFFGRLPVSQCVATGRCGSGLKVACDGLDLRRWVYGRLKLHAAHLGRSIRKKLNLALSSPDCMLPHVFCFPRSWVR